MEVINAILYVSDLEQSKRFYIEELGLEASNEDERFVAFDTGPCSLSIKVVEEEREIAGAQTIVLKVKTVDELFTRHKRASNRVYSGLVQEEWGRTFSILDPDGNRIELVQE